MLVLKEKKKFFKKIWSTFKENSLIIIIILISN